MFSGAAPVLAAAPPPPADHKIFLMVSVALATVSFFVNAIQLVALVYHELLLRDVRNVLLLTQAVAGLAATFTVVYPIQLVTSRHPGHWRHPADLFGGSSGSATTSDESPPSSTACLSLASGLYLVAILLAVTTSTLLVLEQYLRVAQPRRHARFRQDFVLGSACVAAAWTESALLALLPWLGWNNWRGFCLLPDVWTPGFTALLAAVVSAHLLAELWMVARVWLQLRRRAYAVQPGEDMPVLGGAGLGVGRIGAGYGVGGGVTPRAFAAAPAVPAAEEADTSGGAGDTRQAARLSTAAFATTALCHAPFFAHVLWQARCADAAECRAAELDPMRTDVFLWTSLLLLVNAVAGPLLYVFGDEQLSKPSLDVLRLCCCPFRCVAESLDSTP